MTRDLGALVRGLGLSDSEADTYLALVAGARSASELVKVTGQKRPTVYYALGCLERRGLVAKTGRAAGSRFELAPPEHLATLALERVKQAEQLSEEVASALPLLIPPSAAQEGKPSVAFFEGKDAVARVVMDVLYAKNKHLDILAPNNNFFWQVGDGFVERFVAERQRRGIRTRSLWEAPVARSIMKQYYEDSKVRIVPPVMRGSFATSVFIYDEQVLYVSSLKNSYAILITSTEHAATMRAWFEGLWGASKPHGSGK